VGADVAINASDPEVVSRVVAETAGGAHGVLITAVSNQAFSQGIQLARRRGTIVLTGLPPGNFPVPIFDVVLKRLTIRGSIVGTRNDLNEALAFAAERKVFAQVHTTTLDRINDVFDALRRGTVHGRTVLQMS
jgi:propanol-preferring alcohol dehydrogenase